MHVNKKKSFEINFCLLNKIEVEIFVNLPMDFALFVCYTVSERRGNDGKVQWEFKLWHLKLNMPEGLEEKGR